MKSVQYMTPPQRKLSIRDRLIPALLLETLLLLESMKKISRGKDSSLEQFPAQA